MGNQWKQWHTLFWGAPKSLQMLIAAMKLKTVAPWKKSYDKPRQHNKSRDITLPTKVHLVKAMVFLVVLYGCECWTIKKAEHQRTYAFELWYLGILLRVLWTVRRSNQSVLKKWVLNIHWTIDAEAPILGPPHVKNWLIGKDPDAGKDWRQKEKGATEDEMVGWMASLTQWTWVWTSSRRWCRTGKLAMLQSMGL